MLEHFAAGLSAAYLQRRELTASEAGMEMAWQLASELDEGGGEITLQLCSWHASEAIKKKLIKVGYPKELRKTISSAIWTWVNSNSVAELHENRNALLDLLHDSEREYILTYYKQRECHFITALTKHLSNLGCKFSQRVESSHNDIKDVTSRHTSIQKAVEKIIEQVKRAMLAYESEINEQRRKLPRLLNREAFSIISTIFTFRLRYGLACVPISFISQAWHMTLSNLGSKHKISKGQLKPTPMEPF